MLLKNENDWKLLKEDLEQVFLDFEEEECPNKYPCLVLYHFAEDLEFGDEYGIGFVYMSDFPKK